MKHYSGINHRSRRKLITAIAFCIGMVCTSVIAAQSELIDKDDRELARLVRQFSDATAKALREDERVKKDDEQQQLAILALDGRPFEPLNRNLFVPAIYPETPPLVPASGPPPTEEQVRALLRDYLAKDWPDDPRIQNIALDIFNHPLVKEKIPNPSLRAALLGLGRTIAVDAIEFILFAETPEGLPLVMEIKFDDQNVIVDNTMAVSLINNTTDQLTFVFNKLYEAENPFLFSQLFAHEPLHSDSQRGAFEEATATAIQTFVSLQQLSRHPELAGLGTELARRNNSNTLARLNAGEGHRLGNETNDDRSLLPGSPLLFTAWFDQFENLPNLIPTPGNELLADYLSRLQEKDTTQCSADEFNEDLVFCVLENQRGLTPEKLVAAANALQLDTGLPTPELQHESTLVALE